MTAFVQKLDIALRTIAENTDLESPQSDQDWWNNLSRDKIAMVSNTLELESGEDEDPMGGIVAGGHLSVQSRTYHDMHGEIVFKISPQFEKMFREAYDEVGIPDEIVTILNKSVARKFRHGVKVESWLTELQPGVLKFSPDEVSVQPPERDWD